MWFHLFTGNHNRLGKASLHDMTDWVASGLTDLRHTVTVGDTIAPRAINIIWENFRDQDIGIFENRNFKFGLIMTEVPTGRTFNFLDQEPWLSRRRAFDAIGPKAQFIWSMMEEAVAPYRQWAPAGYLELGFTEKLVDPIFAREPDIDFGYYGQGLTSYRGSVLERLRKHCTITTPDRFLTGHDLSAFIATFKVGICLKHSQHWPIPSMPRIARLLHAKRGIAAEYVPMQTRASALAPMAGKDQDFVEFCLDCVHGPWKQRAEEAHERFRATMPMKQIMERLLDTTILQASVSAPVLADDGKRSSVRFEASHEPILIRTHRNYNIVRYKSRVYALNHAVGAVDVASEGSTLAQRFGPRNVIVCSTVWEAFWRVKALLAAQKSRRFLRRRLGTLMRLIRVPGWRKVAAPEEAPRDNK